MKKLNIVLCTILASLALMTTSASAEVYKVTRYCTANGSTIHQVDFINSGRREATYKLMADSGSNYTLKHRFTLKPGRSVSFLVPADGRTQLTMTKYRRVIFSRVVRDICL